MGKPAPASQEDVAALAAQAEADAKRIAAVEAEVAALKAVVASALGVNV